MEIASPGTFDDMVKNHEARDGYQHVENLEEWTRKYIKKGYRILQDGSPREILEAFEKEIDRAARQLAKDTELWRTLRPLEHLEYDAMDRYQRLLD